MFLLRDSVTRISSYLGKFAPEHGLQAEKLQGVQKKLRRSFCLISLATNMLGGWDIIHWEGGIHSFVWSAKTCTIFGSRDISKLKWGIRFQNV